MTNDFVTHLTRERNRTEARLEEVTTELQYAEQWGDGYYGLAEERKALLTRLVAINKRLTQYIKFQPTKQQGRIITDVSGSGLLRPHTRTT